MDKFIVSSAKSHAYLGIVLLNSEYRELDCILEMKADIKTESILRGNYGETIFSEKLNELSSQNDVVYFVISNIDKVSDEIQRRFVGLVKDRSYRGYHLPENVVVVFTVEDKNDLSNIVYDLAKLLKSAI